MVSDVVLSAGDYALGLTPAAGGSVDYFTWRGEPLMRTRCGPGPLDSASFPLVPFSNRITHGRFEAHGGTISLAPNFPGSDHPHTLHGFGWLNPWRLSECDSSRAVLFYRHEAAAWPWRFEAEQVFELCSSGLRHELSVTNLDEAAMPAGIGVHPYFPCTNKTIYRGLHRGEWRVDAECLPLGLRMAPELIDWWDGQPVATRAVDTVYTDRNGPLSIHWPERGVALTISPSAPLRFTVVFTPTEQEFFCVEPVSHMTDAVNRRGEDSGVVWLMRGEVLRAEILYHAHAAS